MNSRYTESNATTKLVSKGLILCLVFLLVSQISLMGQVTASVWEEDSPGDQQQLVSVDFEKQLLTDVLQELARKVKAGISYETGIVPSQRVSYQAENQSVFEILEAVLEGTSLQAELAENRKVILIKRKPSQVQLAVQSTITGTVKDASTGETLPGVNILVKGTSTGASTDADGQYELTVESLQDTLVVSFVGYKTRQVPVNGRTKIDVALQKQAVSGEEMVVIGFGEVAKSDLTGSVSSVKAESFQNQSLTQLTNMLSGTVAGVNITQGSSAAGGGGIQIRGRNSLTAGTSPMVVVDGAVYDGSLRTINPEDIESIDVLKGASAAAIYGSRAASGVILVTTKKGTVSKPVINVTTKIGGTQSTNNNYGVRGPEDYIKYRQSYLRSTSEINPDYYYSNPKNLPEGVNLEQWRAANSNPIPDDTQEFLSRLNFFPIEREAYVAGHHINWYDKVMQTGLRQNYNISVRGGSERTKYYLSGGYVNNEGIIRGDQFSTIRTRLNLNYEIVDWLQVGTNTQFSVRDESAVPASLGNMQIVSPYAYMRNEDGTLNWAPGGYTGAENPLINNLGQVKDRKINELFSSLYAKATLPYGVTYKISFQPNFISKRDYDYWSPQTITGGRDFSNGVAQRTDYHRLRWMLQNLLKWKKAFGVHKFDVTLMQNAEKSKTWNSFMQNSDFEPFPALEYSGMQYGTKPSINTNDTQYTANALLARLNYTLLDKYLLTASIRRDGYSAFGQRYPTATFPSFAGAWQIAKEKFFNADWISRLKLRLSWGVNGNRDIGLYSALPTLAQRPYYNGSDLQIGLSYSGLGNTSLRWEETTSTNLGIDIGILEDRISLTADVYKQTTDQLLVNRTLPRVTGFSNITTNLGEVGNKGIEITMNTVNINSSDLQWNSHLVFSLNRNEIKKLYGNRGQYTLMGKTYEGRIPDFQNEWFQGRAIDAVWDYDMTGIWQEDEAEAAAQYGLEPGDIKARDLNSDNAYTEFQDKVFIGHTEPRYRIGLRNTVDFLQNFTASIFINASLGHIRPFPHAIHYHSTYNARNTPPVPYWTKENRSNEWPRLSSNRAPFGGGVMVYKPASFVRIQDLSLSYTLPSAIVEPLQLKNTRIYGSIHNLATFTNWPGWDPESAFNNPMPRTFTIGINVSL